MKAFATAKAWARCSDTSSNSACTTTTRSAEVDKFIYPLRKQFPLVADALASTKTAPDVPIEAIEARNVLDGKKLVDQITKSGITAYPWGVTWSAGGQIQTSRPHSTAPPTRCSIPTTRLPTWRLAEGVYQAVQGNYDRVASTIAAYTTGNFPPEPAIVDTAPPGIGLTHRFAIQFRPGLAAPPGATPRAQAEPAIDDWLTGMLPPLDHIACTVTWNDPVTALAQHHHRYARRSRLRPIDALYLLKPDNVQAMAELDDRIQRLVVANWNPRPDALVEDSVHDRCPMGVQHVRKRAAVAQPSLAIDDSRGPCAPATFCAPTTPASKTTRPSSWTSLASRRRLASLTALVGDIDAFVNTTLAPLLADTTSQPRPDHRERRHVSWPTP